MFSPVKKLNIIRVLLSHTTNLDWALHQFEVNNVFLHGDLEEEIYMDILLGYNAFSKTVVVCKFQKTLYGLQQSYHNIF